MVSQSNRDSKAKYNPPAGIDNKTSFDEEAAKVMVKK